MPFLPGTQALFELRELTSIDLLVEPFEQMMAAPAGRKSRSISASQARASVCSNQSANPRRSGSGSCSIAALIASTVIS